LTDKEQKTQPYNIQQEHTMTATTNQAKKETYRKMLDRHHEEHNSFQGIFFAFSESQFDDGMKKIGLNPQELHKIVRLGDTGGYILKDKVDEYKSMHSRIQDEKEQFLADQENLYNALVYELCNHEFMITWNPAPALDALGLNKKDIDPALLQRACIEAGNEEE
jgi:hypothetical protein